MMESNNVAYSFDKVDILSKMPMNLLLMQFDTVKLRKVCADFGIVHLDNDDKPWKFQSLIYVVAPTSEFFRLLSKYNISEYIINAVEIAKDEMRRTENEAMLESYKSMMLLKKRYTTKFHLADYRGSCHSTKSANTKGKFSEMTLGLGSKTFVYKIYARYSKVTGEICIHSEWKISRSHNIYVRTGIETIKDCIDLNLMECYENLTSKYIVNEDINIERLGKWILGWGTKRKFTPKEFGRISLAGNFFLSIYKIGSAAQLADWFKNEKIRINTKPGMKSAWDIKVRKLQSNCWFNDSIIM
jgi:hypothetical protein